MLAEHKEAAGVFPQYQSMSAQEVKAIKGKSQGDPVCSPQGH